MKFINLMNCGLFFQCVVVLVFCGNAFSHPGRLDGNGGHNDHKNGTYHKHPERSNSSSNYNTSSKRQSAAYYRNNLKITYPKKKTAPPVSTEKLAKSKVIKVEKVLKIMDGDTVKVQLSNGKIVTVRFSGIDTPEKGQNGGIAARGALIEMLQGKDISIKAVDTDRYGRTVAVVYANGHNVNEMMVKSGYAWAYRKYLDGDLKEKMVQYETSARRSHRGLWWDKDIQAPWEWRKQKRAKD